MMCLVTSQIEGAPIEDISMNSMGHRQFHEELPSPNHPIDDIEILAVTNSHQKKGFITTSSMTALASMNDAVWSNGIYSVTWCHFIWHRKKKFLILAVTLLKITEDFFSFQESSQEEMFNSCSRLLVSQTFVSLVVVVPTKILSSLRCVFTVTHNGSFLEVFDMKSILCGPMTRVHRLNRERNPFFLLLYQFISWRVKEEKK